MRLSLAALLFAASASACLVQAPGAALAQGGPAQAASGIVQPAAPFALHAAPPPCATAPAHPANLGYPTAAAYASNHAAYAGGAVQPAGAAIGCTDPAGQYPAGQYPAGQYPAGCGPYGPHPGQACAPGCQPTCQPPCPPPCPPAGPPREAIPRDAVPRDAVPTGNYVAPPPTGAIVGPERGFDLGGVSLIFPECKISLPRLRFSRGNHFFREGHMELDGVRAPYVENPYAAYQQLVQQEAVDREAEQVPREAQPPQPPEVPREAVPTKQPPVQAPRDAVPGKAPYPAPQQIPYPTPTPDKFSQHPAATHERLDRIERALELQMQAMQQCMEQIKSIRESAPYAASGPGPAPVPGSQPLSYGHGHSHHPGAAPPALSGWSSPAAQTAAHSAYAPSPQVAPHAASASYLEPVREPTSPPIFSTPGHGYLPR